MYKARWDGQYGLRVAEVHGAVLSEGDALPDVEFSGGHRRPGVGERRGVKQCELRAEQWWPKRDVLDKKVRQ